MRRHVAAESWRADEHARVCVFAADVFRARQTPAHLAGLQDTILGGLREVQDRLTLLDRRRKPRAARLKARCGGAPGFGRFMGERFRPPDVALRLRLRASATVGPRPVMTPPQGWNGPDAGQLSVWLAIAAEAQESAAAATAIRLYFFVLEDLQKLLGLVAPLPQSDFDDFKAIRDFVSHPKIDSSRTQQRLHACAAALTQGPDVFRYRPSSSQDRAELDSWRPKLRAVADAELRTRLDV